MCVLSGLLPKCIFTVLQVYGLPASEIHFSGLSGPELSRVYCYGFINVWVTCKQIWLDCRFFQLPRNYYHSLINVQDLSKLISLVTGVT